MNPSTLPPAPASPVESAQTLAVDLENVHSAPRPWGAIASGFVAFVSLGTLPTLLWHDRFKDFVEDERVYLRRFADWIRLQSGHPATMNLRTAGERLGPRSFLSVLAILPIVGICLLFASEIDAGRSLLDQVMAYTYEFHRFQPGTPAYCEHRDLFAGWSIALSVAYLFQWIQVQAHTSDTRRFVRYTNEVLQRRGVLRVPEPRVGLGVAILWAIVAALLATKGAWWAIAMALAGAVQYRYMASQSPRLRRTLAARVREIARLPASGIGQKCPHPGCLAPLPTGARFCTRCGRNLSA